MTRPDVEGVLITLENAVGTDRVRDYVYRLEAVVEAARRVVGYGPDNVGRYGLGSWDEMRDALAALDAGGESRG